MIQKTIFYLKVLLAGAWFFLTTFLGLFILIVRWKDPNMGAIMARFLNWGSCKILGYRIRVEGSENLYKNQPCVYTINHQSNIDIMTMGGMFPYKTVVIGKKEMRKIPLFGWFFSGTGMVMIDRKDRTQAIAGLAEVTEAIVKKGHSIWIFPEGTRNHGKELLPFKKGAFHMAITAQVPIVPIVQQNLLSYLDIKNRQIIPGTILIRVLEAIPTLGMTTDDVITLMAKVRSAMEVEMKNK